MIFDKLVPLRLLQKLAKMSQRGFKDVIEITTLLLWDRSYLSNLWNTYIGCHPYKRMRHMQCPEIMTICTLTLIGYLVRISGIITGQVSLSAHVS